MKQLYLWLEALVVGAVVPTCRCPTKALESARQAIADGGERVSSSANDFTWA